MAFDWTYLVLVLPAMFFAMWASSRVSSTFKKYQNQLSSKRITGLQAAQTVLNANGLTNIKIERIKGQLTDHFSPTENIIRLSEPVYDSTSTAAIGVACHEAGHAIQYAVGYAPIKLRMAILPVTNFGGRFSPYLIMGGLILSSMSQDPTFGIYLAYAGIILFGAVLLFQLFTLPTEFNASSRALQAIQQHDILTPAEMEATKKVLSAAALTYVAALAVTLMQLIRFLIIVSGRRR